MADMRAPAAPPYRMDRAHGGQSEREPRGEYVLILEGAEAIAAEEDFSSLSPDEHVKKYTDAGMSKKEAIKAAAKDRGMSKSEFYKLVAND